MDNIKVDISNIKIYFKKGKIKIQWLYKYMSFMILMGIVLSILFLKYEENSLYIPWWLQFLRNTSVLFLLKINYFFFVALCLLFSTSLFRNIYLEEIILSDKIEIRSIDYKVNLEYNALQKIMVRSFYESNYSFFNRGTYYSHFKDKCTIIFTTKDDKEYEWGFNLSYQKGIEIKQMIEEKICDLDV